MFQNFKVATRISTQEVAWWLSYNEQSFNNFKNRKKNIFFSAEAKIESSRIRQSFDFCSNHQILQSTEEAENPPNRDSKSSENNGNISESLSTDTEVKSFKNSKSKHCLQNSSSPIGCYFRLRVVLQDMEQKLLETALVTLTLTLLSMSTGKKPLFRPPSKNAQCQKQRGLQRLQLPSFWWPPWSWFSLMGCNLS